MDAELERLKTEREQLASRLARIDVVIGKYEALRAEAAELLDSGSAQSAMPESAQAVGSHSVVMEPRDHLEPLAATPLEDFNKLALEALAVATKPMPRGQLYDVLRRKGVVVLGADPLNALATRLYRLEEVINLRGHGYWLKNRPYHPAKYVPDEPSDILF